MSKFAVSVLCAAMAAGIAAAQESAGLYRSRCSACHATDGSGNTPAGQKMHAPDLRRNGTQKKSDRELNDVVGSGGPMRRASHAFSSKGMNVEQVRALVAYIRTLGK